MTEIRDRYLSAINQFNAYRAAIDAAFNDIVKQQLILDDPTKSAADKKKAADAITAAKANIVSSAKSQEEALKNINQIMVEANLKPGSAWDMPLKPADDDSKWAMVYVDEPTGGYDEYGYPVTNSVGYFADANGNPLPPGAPESARVLSADYVNKLNKYNAEQDRLRQFGEQVVDGIELAEDINKYKGNSGIKDADVDPRLIVADFYSAQSNLAAAQEKYKKGKELLADGEKINDPDVIAAGKALLREAGMLARSTLSRMKNDAISAGFIGATQGGDLMGVPYTAEQIAMRDDFVAARTMSETIVKDAAAALGDSTGGTNGSGGTNGAVSSTVYARSKSMFAQQQTTLEQLGGVYTQAQKMIAEGKAESPPNQNKIKSGERLLLRMQNQAHQALQKMKTAAYNGRWSDAAPGKIDPSTGKAYTAEKIDLANRLKWFDGIVNTIRNGGTLPNGGNVKYVPPPNPPVDVAVQVSEQKQAA